MSSMELLRAAFSDKAWEDCVRIGREILPSLQGRDHDTASFLIAKGLLELSPPEVDEAIAIYLGLLENDPGPKFTSRITKGLGFAFGERKTGSRAANLKSSVAYYSHALDCDTLSVPLQASLRASIGFACCELSTLEELESELHLAHATLHLTAAIALEEDPEHLDEMQTSLDWARAQRDPTR